MKKMRKILCVVLAMVMLCGLTACGSGKSPEVPDDSVYKSDVQDYITEMLDENAKIDIFEKANVDESDDQLVVTCNVLYSSDAGESQGEFELTYVLEDKEWTLSKCRVTMDEAPAEEAAEDTEEPKEEKDNKEQASATELSDDLFDFTFELDGVVYQLPFAYTELADNGWTISSTGVSTESTFSANSYDFVYMSKNGSKVCAYIINMSGNTKALKDCKVGGIEVYHKDLMDPNLFKIAKGINTTSSKDDITAAFGGANSTNSYDDYTYLDYETDNTYVCAEFCCYNEDADYQNNCIELRNFVSDESDVTETSSEVPEYLSTYVTPTELGDDLISCNIELAGDLYHLPAPVSVFTDNGWEITSKGNSIGAGNTDSIKIEKDGESLYAYIINFADYQTIPENCAVYSLTISSDYNDIEVTFPGGLTFDTDKADAEALISDDFSYYKGTYSYSYDYSDYKAGISVGIDIDIATEKVNQFNISSKLWSYE